MSRPAARTNTPDLLGQRYERLAPIGAGSAASVFRVRDRRDGALRAAKVLSPEKAAIPQTLARFEDEFRILRTLHHPHLPEVYDYGWTDEGGRFLVMELVDGLPLDHYFREHPRDIWVILYELTETLVFIHNHNLLHQDIKPSNILVKRSAAYGEEMPLVKLIDFGLTYRRDTGAAVQLVGTPAYVAPEVVRGEAPLTRAVDYYSLGITLFELLAGHPPFEGSEGEVLRAHLSETPHFEHEAVEWAELYPHVRALLSKDTRKRLEAFEELKSAVISRLTGGIASLDQAYGLARIDSMGMIGKEEVWKELVELTGVGSERGSKKLLTVIAGPSEIGKTYLLEHLLAKFVLNGYAPIQLGIHSDWPWLCSSATHASSPKGLAAKVLAAWETIEQLVSARHVILSLDSIESLGPEEAAFIRYLTTRLSLIDSDNIRTRILIVGIGADSLSQPVMGLAEDTYALCLVGDGNVSGDDLVLNLRGTMFDSRDAREIARRIHGCDGVGNMLARLRTALSSTHITFRKWIWKYHFRVDAHTQRPPEADGEQDFSFLGLTSTQLRCMSFLATDEQPMPVGWIRDIQALSETELDRLLDMLHVRRLIYFTRWGGWECVAVRGGALRRWLYNAASIADRVAFHSHLANNWRSQSITSEDEISCLVRAAQHLLRLGDWRSAATLHINIVRNVWKESPSKRRYEVIENICNEGMAMFGRDDEPSSSHLYAYYLKQSVRALWARNMFARARMLFTSDRRVPSSLLPQYVRSVLEKEGPDAALVELKRIDRRARGYSRQLVCRLILERALTLIQKGQYGLSRTQLDGIGSGSDLTVRDRYRRQIYYAMISAETDRASSLRRGPELSVKKAFAGGFVDEAILMSALNARNLIGKGDLSGAVRQMATGMRAANAHGLHLRQNLLYRLAAAAYAEMGDLQRARRCQERALQISGMLGIADFKAISWARLAEYERIVGKYGNALRYIETAIALLGEHGVEMNRIQAHTLRFELHVTLKTNDRKRLHSDLSRRMRGIVGRSELGFFESWQGKWFRQNGDRAAAVQCFRRARRHFEESGFGINATWVALKELDCYLDVNNKKHARMIRVLSRRVSKAGTNTIQTEFLVRVLSLHYLQRDPWSVTLPVIKRCETMLRRNRDIEVELEAARLLFLLYARRGLVLKADRWFARYRDRIREVVANLEGGEYLESYAESVSLEETVAESRLLRRNTG